MAENERIGFIGLGVMGASMAGHLLRAGYPLTVYTRTKARADGLVGDGAVWADSPAAVAADSEVVVTIVGYPADVEEVYLGEQGVLTTVRPGTVLIDMTTSSPQLARRIAEAAEAKFCHALDAPVSGGDVGAREARLSIMVGGEPEAFRRVLPILQVMGKNIVPQGPAGAGQLTKMANQIACAGSTLGTVEALAYAAKSGLDPQRVFESIEAGAAGSWSLSNLGPRILRGDLDPGFFAKHMLKDLKIALESAEEMGLDLPGLRTAHDLYDRLCAEGLGDLGTQGLYRLYED